MKRRKSAQRVVPSRSEPFRRDLGSLRSISPPGISAAILVDPEGEAVDYAESPRIRRQGCGCLLPYRARRYLVPPFEQGGLSQHVVVRAQKRSFVVRSLPDGYALVVVLKRDGFAISFRAVDIAERELCKEAGWSLPSSRGAVWYPVVIETTPRDRRRPSRMRTNSTWEGIEVLGSIVGMGRERGYRCRLRSGAELTLIREPAGNWYADERFDQNDQPAATPKRAATPKKRS